MNFTNIQTCNVAWALHPKEISVVLEVVDRIFALTNYPNKGSFVLGAQKFYKTEVSILARFNLENGAANIETGDEKPVTSDTLTEDMIREIRESNYPTLKAQANGSGVSFSVEADFGKYVAAFMAMHTNSGSDPKPYPCETKVLYAVIETLNHLRNADEILKVSAQDIRQKHSDIGSIRRIVDRIFEKGQLHAIEDWECWYSKRMLDGEI